MMTGKDLIIYILENGLEDEEMFVDGRINGFLTEQEAAIKLDVGVETVKALVQLGALEGISIGDSVYIVKLPPNS